MNEKNKRNDGSAAAAGAAAAADGRGGLFVVATPIGNLGDMTPRAVETLRQADLIAAEDTRNSVKLLNYFDIHTPMTSYHEFNKYDKATLLVQEMLAGKNVAIVTDAGTPCISDPGEVLVAEAVRAGLSVTSLPGASAVITALTLSGLPTRRFVFEGFLPPVKQKKERQAAFSRLKRETRTMVLYEAPHHLKQTLSELSEVLGGERRVSLCREMTKRYEEVVRTTLSAAAELPVKGEYVLVIEGCSEEALLEEQQAAAAAVSLSERVLQLEESGLSHKEAMKAAATERGMSRRDVYQALLKEAKEEKDDTI